MATTNIYKCDKCGRKVVDADQIRHVRIYKVDGPAFMGNAVYQIDLCIFCIKRMELEENNGRSMDQNV